MSGFTFYVFPSYLNDPFLTGIKFPLEIHEYDFSERFTVLIGKNGVGKTQFMSHMAHALDPTSPGNSLLGFKKWTAGYSLNRALVENEAGKIHYFGVEPDPFYGFEKLAACFPTGSAFSNSIEHASNAGYLLNSDIEIDTTEGVKSELLTNGRIVIIPSEKRSLDRTGFDDAAVTNVPTGAYICRLGKDTPNLQECISEIQGVFKSYIEYLKTDFGVDIRNYKGEFKSEEISVFEPDNLLYWLQGLTNGSQNYNILRNIAFSPWFLNSRIVWEGNVGGELGKFYIGLVETTEKERTHFVSRQIAVQNFARTSIDASIMNKKALPPHGRKDKVYEIVLDALDLLKDWGLGGLIGSEIRIDNSRAIYVDTPVGKVRSFPFDHENEVNPLGIEMLDGSVESRYNHQLSEIARTWIYRAIGLVELVNSKKRFLETGLGEYPLNVVIWDEPEKGLHPSATDFLLKKVKLWIEVNDVQLICATHSISIASEADAVYEVSRNESTSLPTLTRKPNLDEKTLHRVGFTRKEILFSKSPILLCEGPHDRLVFELIFANDLKNYGFKIFDISGTKSLNVNVGPNATDLRTPDLSILLDYLDSRIIVVLDGGSKSGISKRELARLNQTLAKNNPNETKILIESLSEKIRKIKSNRNEGKSIIRFIDQILERTEKIDLSRLQFAMLPKDDITLYFELKSLYRSNLPYENWDSVDEIRSSLIRVNGRFNFDMATKSLKSFIKERHNKDIDMELLENAILDSKIHPDFIRLKQEIFPNPIDKTISEILET